MRRYDNNYDKRYSYYHYDKKEENKYTKKMLYSAYNKLNVKLKDSGLILYSDKYLCEFLRDNSDIFTLNENQISLNPEYDLEWLKQNITDNYSSAKSYLLGLNNKSASNSITMS